MNSRGSKKAGRAKVIMVQGTTSHAGKSMFATALCRIFAQEGLRVAPFKSQNMSLNSFVTPDGGEFGRAQAVQADAARVAPTVEMNPILLKPEAERRSQVVVMGKPLRVASAREYYEMKLELWPVVTAALDNLLSNYDMVVIEGAGSPAEINLKEHGIVNMRVALYAQAPVVLVGDIDRGGVFASLAGTMLLLEPEERAIVKAIVINKFRGDPSLLDSGLEMILERTGVPVVGVVPYYTDIHVPEEDSLGIDPDEQSSAEAVLDVAVIRLPHIANFDDFDPLRQEPGVRVRYVEGSDELGRPDLIVIPGTKTTVEDLLWLGENGMVEAVKQRRSEGVPVMGICGGYQMLGRRVLDPNGVESERAEVEGLGLLPVETVFEGDKATHQVKGTVNSRLGLLEDYAHTGGDGDVVGYEIHMGRTTGEAVESLFNISERSGQAVNARDGAVDSEGLTLGTYMHGLFHNHGLRRTILLNLARRKGVKLPEGSALDLDGEYDKLADHIRQHVDMDVIYQMVGLR